jgi:hypothetical protein
MAYEESSANDESNVDSSEDIDVNDDEIESSGSSEDEEAQASDEKNGNHHALEVRRAIEDHLERSRLQKEFDYLFDDKFTEQEDE